MVIKHQRIQGVRGRRIRPNGRGPMIFMPQNVNFHKKYVQNMLEIDNMNYTITVNNYV